jgi:predicted regulator of Ras-like GTPase activity (Roadblock/LC7/MglB family)
MDVARALAEFEELSTQVTRAVILDGEGVVAGAFGADRDRAAALARIASDLLAGASTVRPEGGEVTRVEVVTLEGGVFVVREHGLTAVATTVPDPTSGLVVYDLRTALRRATGEAA